MQGTGMQGTASSLLPPTDIWDPGKFKVLGERVGGFVLSSGCTIPVDFDTNSAVCVTPRTIFHNYFSDKHVYSFEEKNFDIQETSVPYEGVVCNDDIDPCLLLYYQTKHMELRILLEFGTFCTLSQTQKRNQSIARSLHLLVVLIQLTK
jgi:hypothetical protein